MPDGSWQHTTALEIRATVVAGIWLGALVGGVGGRLAMMALRVLSPDSVRGVISDHGFTIGRLTFAGTTFLIVACAAIGLIGSLAYRWVEHWLIGPAWFRQLTAATGAGLVVGSMLVNGGGPDFTLLRPLELAVAFFILIPALFGFFIGPLQRALARPDAWVNRRWRGWVFPLVTVAVFPPMIVVAVFAAAFMMLSGAIHEDAQFLSFRDRRSVGLVVRAGWFGVAAFGAVTLVSDTVTILS